MNVLCVGHWRISCKDVAFNHHKSNRRRIRCIRAYLGQDNTSFQEVAWAPCSQHGQDVRWDPDGRWRRLGVAGTHNRGDRDSPWVDMHLEEADAHKVVAAVAAAPWGTCSVVRTC